MTSLKLLRNQFVLLGIGIVVLIISSPQKSFAFQLGNGNTISGYVFGLQRQPVPDVDVELSDDYSRSISRVRTSSSGRFLFTVMSSGRFRVRVLPYATNYEEQTQEVEIQNFSRPTSNGQTIRSGFDNTTVDFFLKPRRGADGTLMNTVVFAQDIPKEAKAKFDSGLLKLGSKDNQAALGDIKAAIEIFPNYYDALNTYGNECIKLKYFDAARVLLAKAVEVNPKSYSAWYGLAYANYSLNQTQEALDDVAKGLALSPDSVQALLLNGILLRQNKKYDESLSQLKKAKELAKGTIPEINWNLALLYSYNFKQYDKAADELELFLKEQPDAKDNAGIKKTIADLRAKAGNK